jgi:hypothetical protein
MRPRQRGIRLLEDLLLHLVEPLPELFDLREVVVDHRIDDPIHEQAGPLTQDPIVFRAHVADFVDRTRHPGVNGHQILRTQEEIDVFRGEAMLRRLEVDPVKNQIEVIAVRFDLWMVNFRERIFHGELVEVEHVGQDAGLVWRGRLQRHPDPDTAVRFEPGGVHPVDFRGDPAVVFENLDQSPTLTASAACAAANRATGTRYGEQLT